MLSFPVLLTCVLAGLGLYLNIPANHDHRLRAAGYALLGLALLAGAGWLWRQPVGPVEPTAADALPLWIRGVFSLLAGAGLTAAVVIVTSRAVRHTMAAAFCLVVVNAGLLVLLNASWLAAGTILIVGSGLTVSWRAVPAAGRPSLRDRDEPPPREPLLACATGIVLAAVFIGTIQLVATTEIGRLHGTDRQPALPDRATAQAVRDRLRPAAQHRPEAEAGDPSMGAILFGEQGLSIVLVAALLPVAAVGTVLFCERTAARPPIESSILSNNPS